MEAPPKGPYVQAALFCEMVLEGKDNVMSIIRVVDRVTHTAVGPKAPEDLPPFTYGMHAVIMLKAGDAKGRENLSLVREAPDGSREPITSGSVNFSGAPQQGVTVNIRIEATYQQEGVYWFDVLLDDKPLTRMPLEVVYQRVTPGRVS